MILAPESPFMIMERKGKFYFHRLPQSLKISSIAQIRQSKVSKERVFLFVSEADQTFNIMRIPFLFDPRASPECVDNYLIKQVFFDKKSLKKACIFNPDAERRYLLLSLYSNVYSQSKPAEPPTFQYEI